MKSLTVILFAAFLRVAYTRFQRDVHAHQDVERDSLPDDPKVRIAKASKERQLGEARRQRQVGEARQRERLAKSSLQKQRDVERRKDLDETIRLEKEEARKKVEENVRMRAAERAEVTAAAEARILKKQLSSIEMSLVKRAAEVRKQAELSAFVAGQADPFGVMMGSDSTAATTLLRSLSGAVKDLEFMSSMANATSRMQESLARLVFDVEKKIGTFMNESRNADAQHFIVMTAKLVGDLVRDVQGHQQDANEVVMMIRGAVPHTLRTGVMPVVSLAMPVTTPIGVAATKLAWASENDACAQIANISAALGPYYSNITRLRSVLNSTSASLPRLKTLAPDNSPEVVKLVQTVVNLGYMETLAIEDASRDILGRVAPAVIGKLECTFDTSSGARFTTGLIYFAIASVAMWLVF